MSSSVNTLAPARDGRSVPHLRSSRHALDYSALRADVFGFRHLISRGAEVGVRTDDAVEVAAAIHALDGWAGRVHLVPLGVDVDVDMIGRNELVPTASPNSRKADVAVLADSTRWVVYTSGTTGVPKGVDHTVETLSRTVRTSAPSDFIWGLLYDPNRMAGLQVILQAMRSQARLVAPDAYARLAARVDTMRECGVDALSATPTLWRQILQVPGARDWPLRQITLGGEITDQPVLNALGEAFPSARIVHIFASTETGAAFSVSDSRAGFPVDYLSEPPGGIALDVRNGMLYVQAPDIALAGPDGFVATGDRVEIMGDRVLFRGRDTGVVNIGGAHVWPEEVEALLRQHPDVEEAVVSPRTNALSGNLLVAQVVLASSADREGVTKRLRSWVRDSAPGTHVPAVIKVVDKIDVSATGKVQR